MKEASRLRKKLLAYQALTLAAFGLAIGIGVSIILYSYMYNHIVREFVDSTEHQAVSVSEWSIRAKDIAQQITSRTRIREELQKYNQKQITLEELIRFTAPKLCDAMNQSKEVAGVTRLDANGAETVSLGVKPPLQVARQTLASKDKNFLGQTFLQQGKTYLWVWAPIKERLGDFVGNDIVVFATASLNRIIQSCLLGKSEGKAFATFLVIPQRDKLVNVLQPSSCSEKAVDQNLSTEILIKAHQAISKGRNTSFKFENLLCVVNPVANSPWLLINCFDERLLITPLMWKLTLILMVALMAYALCLLGYWTILRPLSQRILLRQDELKAEIDAKAGRLQEELAARKRAEEALIWERQRLAYILEGSNVGTWEWNVQSGEATFNDRWAEIAGYSLEELAPISIDIWQKLAHPDDLKSSAKLLQKHFQGETDNYSCECRMRHKNGHWVWVLDRGKVVTWTPDGMPLLMCGTHLDITKRKQVEEALKSSEAQKRAILDGISANIAFVNQDMEIIWANKASGFSVNLHPVDLVGRKCHALWAHPDKPCENCPTVRAFQTHKTETELMVTPDGRVWEEKGEPVFDNEGNLLGVVEIAQDVTEHKRMERDCAESEERLRTIFEMSPISMAVSEVETGVILDTNQKFEELSGYSKGALVGRTSDELGFFEGLERSKIILQRIMDHGFIDGLELEAISRDGKKLVVQIYSRIIRVSGAPKLLSLVLDITDRKNLEKQLLQSQKMEAVGTLAGGIAHDFNNILAAITGYSELALESSKVGEPAEDEIQAVLAAADRAKELVKRILEFSRQMGFEMKSINLNEVVSEAVSMLERTIPKMISINLNLSPTLKAIEADPNQIVQILLNLASNAKDAMPEGGKLIFETANVYLPAEHAAKHNGASEGEYVQLTVSDTGFGIDKATMSRIFDPFFTTKEIGKGTGLGLASVYGIVKGHGGHIVCESEPGEGTSFEIYFPMAVQDDKKVQQEEPSAGDMPGGTETILVVDDEEALRRLATRILEPRGYRVLTASSGEKALDILQEPGQKVSLVVLDLIMPGIGGKKTLEQISISFPGVKTLVASGYTDEGQVEEVLQHGAAGFVTKPYNRNHLLLEIRRILDA